MPFIQSRLRASLPKFVVLAVIVCAWAIVAVAPASASPTAQKILVLHSLCGTDTADTFIGQIDTNPTIASWDSVDIHEGSSAATPPASLLAPYDGVVALNDCTWSDFTALGNTLADYADTGGVVIAPNWNAWDPAVDAKYALGGRWASGGYSPFSLNQSGKDSPATSMTMDAANPLFAGLAGFQNIYTYATEVAPGATQLSSWDTGTPAVAVKGQALALNGWLGDNAGTTGDYAQLVVNAVKVLGPQAISVSRSGNGVGTVTSSRGGIDCGVICAGSAPAGVQVKFTATAAKGSSFSGWSGGCSGNGACELNAPYPATGAGFTPPVAKFSLATIKAGSFESGSLAVTLPGGGDLVVTSKSTAKLKKHVSAGGKVKLKLKLKSGAKKKLARTGSLKVKLKIVFTPTGAATGSTTHKTVKFKK